PCFALGAFVLWERDESLPTGELKRQSTFNSSTNFCLSFGTGSLLPNAPVEFRRSLPDQQSCEILSVSCRMLSQKVRALSSPSSITPLRRNLTCRTGESLLIAYRHSRKVLPYS